MSFLEFLIRLFTLISFDVLVGFLIWLLYKYVDCKYFSELEIITLKEENNYLKEENKKLNGTSTKFWEDKIWSLVYPDFLDQAKMFMLLI